MFMPERDEQIDQVRKVQKNYDLDERERVIEALKNAEERHEVYKKPKPLKAARSKAEITRVRQGYALLCMAVLQFTGTVVLILSQVFNVL